MGPITVALQGIVRAYEGGETRPIYEVFSPLALLRALLSFNPALGGGRQQDAQECLGALLSTTGLTAQLFRCNSVLTHEQTILCGLDTDAMVSARAAPVDMPNLIRVSLTGDSALQEAPPLLAIQIAKVYNLSDSDWWVDARADWPSELIDLSACVASPHDLAVQPTYRLRALVVHRHAQGPADSGMCSGHYVAYVRHARSWLLADDSKVERHAVAPTEFPYLVFLERVDYCTPAFNDVSLRGPPPSTVPKRRRQTSNCPDSSGNTAARARTSSAVAASAQPSVGAKKQGHDPRWAVDAPRRVEDRTTCRRVDERKRERVDSRVGDHKRVDSRTDSRTGRVRVDSRTERVDSRTGTR